MSLLHIGTLWEYYERVALCSEAVAFSFISPWFRSCSEWLASFTGCPGEGLVGEPSSTSPQSSLYVLLWLSSTWSHSSIHSVNHPTKWIKNVLCAKHCSRNWRHSSEQNRYGPALMIFTCFWAVVASLQDGPSAPCLPVFTPLRGPLPSWIGMTDVTHTHTQI